MKLAIFAHRGRYADIRTAAGAETDIDWWDESVPEAVVCTECFAALELLEHLERIAPSFGPGADIALAETAAEAVGDCVILVGGASTNPAVRELERRLGRSVSAGDVGEDGYRTVGVRVGSTRYIVLSGQTRTGTLYAAYALLEKIGFRWLAPDEYGTVVPEGSREHWAGEWDETDRPAFATRGAYTDFADDSDENLVKWIARNRCNYAMFKHVRHPHRLKKRGIRIGGGGHNLLHRFMHPRADYPYAHPQFGNEGAPDPHPVSPEYAGDANGDGRLSMSEAHPEWFALIGGQRSFRTGDNPEVEGYFWGDNYCTTNGEATRELCGRVVDDLIAGEWKHLDYLDVWLYDNGIWCECETCGRSGNYMDRMAMLVYRLRRRIDEAMAEGRLKRNVKLIFAAYHECLEPPSRPLPEDFDYGNCLVTFFPIERCYVHRFDDPACTETNAQLHAHYRRWTEGDDRTYRGEMFMGEYYNLSSFASLPLVFGDVMAQDFAYYCRSGVRHFHYMHIPIRRWGMLAWNNSLYARLMWNPAERLDDWSPRFLADCYGPVAEHMKPFYETLERASANMKYLKHYQEKGTARRSIFADVERGEDYFPLTHMRYDRVEDDPNAGLSFVDTLRLYAEARVLLNRAMAALVGDGAMYADRPAVRTPQHETYVSRLIDDDMRLTYGERMLSFYDALLLASYLHKQGETRLARQVYDKAQLYGEALEKTTEPLAGNPYCPEWRNGLGASWIERTYRRLRRELFPGDAATNSP